MRMLDVAPTIALAGGVPFPSAEGVAVPGILSAADNNSGSLVDFLMGAGNRDQRR
jgi:hypothetical protein